MKTKGYEYNFCPHCAAPLQNILREGKRHRACVDCGFIHFRDPKVAVVVLIIEAGAVLLVKRAVEPELGKWALPAGFMDYDETPQSAAIRETLEETGLDIRLIDLIDARGNSDGRANLLIIFRAAVLGGQLHAGDDVSEVSYFLPQELPNDEEIAFDSTRQLLRDWLSTIT